MSTVFDTGRPIPLRQEGHRLSASEDWNPVADSINNHVLYLPRSRGPSLWQMAYTGATDIDEFSIFTFDNTPAFSASGHEDIEYNLDQINSSSPCPEVLLTNGSDTFPAELGGPAIFIDYFVPVVLKYDTGDTTPVTGKRLGPKKDTYKVSTLGCGFIALSEPDTDLELIWVMRIPYKPLLGKTQANVTSGTTVTVDEYDDTLMDNGLDIAEVTNNTGQQIDSGSFVWVFELFGHFNKQMFPAQLDDCP